MDVDKKLDEGYIKTTLISISEMWVSITERSQD